MRIETPPQHFGCLAQPVPRRGLLGAAGLGLLAAPRAWGAGDSDKTVDPQAFGLEIPAGKATPGDGRRVLAVDEEGTTVIARLHAELGDHNVVMLPDGKLVSRLKKDALVTDRPFVAAAKADLAKRLLIDKLAGFKSKESRRYLYLYNTSDNFALVTSRILESMFPGIASYYEKQRLGTKNAEVPLVVLMFRTEEEFQAYQRMPPGVVAYYNVLTNQVVMYEESKLYRIKPQLGIQQSLSTIAHEGVHQILHNLGVQQRLSVWPMWIAEGLAEYFAPTTVGKRLQWKGAGQVNDLRMYELENYLKGRSGDAPAGQMVQHTVTAARLTSTGYASAWALTTYLARQERAKFNRYVAEISKLGPFEGATKSVGRGLITDNLTVFCEYFGDDIAALETKLVAYLKKLPYDDPFGEWPHYAVFVLASVAGKPQREANIFHSPESAEKWQRETVNKLPDDAQPQAQAVIREYANRPLAERAASEFLRGR